ncbi:nicotinate-nicotinamide nucleotide adenylyltransferase [Candidatus Sumerlaeota bacterium]|nr:nicotinate-nicotinamide nucleotide adenylyltransferase [Candidatus Sumerlaeota bacterium]
MILGVLGGSFDPPHIAHAMIGFYVLETQGVDRALYCPTAAHPLGKPLTPFAHRLAMTRLAVAQFGERAEALDIEHRLPRPNYTITLLCELQRLHPDAQIRLIIGSDILAECGQWKDFDQIERDFAPIVVPRPGHPVGDETTAMPDVSSSEIRRRLREGEDAASFLHRDVLAYIMRHELYGT